MQEDKKAITTKFRGKNYFDLEFYWNIIHWEFVNQELFLLGSLEDIF